MIQNDDFEKQLRRLGERVGRVEKRMSAGGLVDLSPRDARESDSHRDCSLPMVPERVLDPNVSAHRAELIRIIRQKWANGTKLRYAFFDSSPWGGPPQEQDFVREAFDVWADVGIGIEFEEVDSIDEAEIRIGFLQSGRTWSYVGRDVIDIPGQRERTMNYGWPIADDPRGVDVPVHEIGHTLGFPHEHQNPFAGIVWDDEAVYRHFARQGWDRNTTNHNVIQKLSPSEIEGSRWDPNSIMHYGFPAGLIREPEGYRGGLTPDLGLTELDKDRVRQFFPPQPDARLPTLAPFQLEKLDLLPGDQANFVIQPDSTRDYSVQTFGDADTVVVLFEDRAGDLKFVAGDDDSGTSRNAHIRTRLSPGRRYVLRVRLYLNWSSAETAILLW